MGGGGKPLSDASFKKKKGKKEGFSNFLTVLPPTQIFFGTLFGKYLKFRTYWYHHFENPTVSFYSIKFKKKKKHGNLCGIRGYGIIFKKFIYWSIFVQFWNKWY